MISGLAWLCVRMIAAITLGLVGMVFLSRILIGMFGIDPTEALQDGKPAYGMMLQGVFIGTGLCLGIILGATILR